MMSPARISVNLRSPGAKRRCGLGRGPARSLILMGIALVFGGMTAAFGQAPSPGSVEQGATPMDQIDLGLPYPGMQVFTTPPPEVKTPFIDDAKFDVHLRTFYFNRDQYTNSRSEAWALGGWIGLQSGWLANFFRAGAVVYTSQPLYAPDDRDGTLLLKPGQEGYTVLGQLYGEFKFTDRIFGAVGRKAYDTPYINTDDVRMTPNTFEAITVYGKAGGKDGGKDGVPEWRFGGGYFTKIKEKNSDQFKWMSTVAGASVDRGVYVAGANVDGKDFSFGAINYYSDDVINIFYTEGKYSLPLANEYNLKLSAQYSDQRSTGDDLLTGQSFSTHQWGIKGDLKLGAALLTLAYTDTATGADMRNPWSGYPGYTSAQVKFFNRAGESAVMLRGAYDFSSHGAEGLSAYALWVYGSGRSAPAFNEDEADFNLQWAPKTGALRGTSFRIRYAHVSQRGGGDPNINDFRVIVNYAF